jgi:hypothetical protein
MRTHQAFLGRIVDRPGPMEQGRLGVRLSGNRVGAGPEALPGA